MQEELSAPRWMGKELQLLLPRNDNKAGDGVRAGLCLQTFLYPFLSRLSKRIYFVPSRISLGDIVASHPSTAYRFPAKFNNPKTLALILTQLLNNNSHGE